MTSRLGPVAIISAGSTVWRTSVPLPAVPMTKRYSPGRTALGLKVSAVELSEAPSVSAAPTSVAARTAVKCWRSSPGRSRRERMFSIRNGLPVARERLSDVRRI